MNCALADARIRAVGDDLSLQIKTIAEGGRGMEQKLTLQGEGHLIGPGQKLANLYRIGKLFQGNGEGIIDYGVQDISGALLSEYLQPLREGS